MLTIRKHTDHGESVHKLIPKSVPPTPKMPMYISRFARKVSEDSAHYKIGEHKTMGFAKVPLDPPELYLRKHTRAPISLYPSSDPKGLLFHSSVQTEETPVINEQLESAIVDEDTYCGEAAKVVPASENTFEKSSVAANWRSVVPHRRQHRQDELKPTVPATCCSRFHQLDRGEKDFVMDNTLSALRQPAKIPYPRYVDDPKGNARDWCKSGLVRKYVMRSDFGMIPQYIRERKAEMQAKQEQEIRAAEQARCRQLQKCRKLTEDERRTLIIGLKRLWEQVYNDYQSMPLVVDRPMAVKQKANLEHRLTEIEKDIQFVEEHNYIFVSDAQRTFYLE